MIGEVRHIRAFLTVARLCNFTRATNELHVSQSALTVQIKQLEDALGVVLFDRSRRGVSLTQAGKDVLVPLERILIDTEALISRRTAASGTARVYQATSWNYRPDHGSRFCEGNRGREEERGRFWNRDTNETRPRTESHASFNGPARCLRAHQPSIGATRLGEPERTSEIPADSHRQGQQRTGGPRALTEKGKLVDCSRV